jgi:histidinol dehydrogenase
MIRIISPANLKRGTQREPEHPKQQQIVKDLLAQVRTEGDAALYRLTERLDGASLSTLLVSDEERKLAYTQVSTELVEALQAASQRIRKYHEKQKQNTWLSPEEDGTILGQVVRPLERVGVYVPGGRAAYPSTVMMNVIPAQVAGVEEIVMVTPPQTDGSLYAPTLVAADLLGVKPIYKVGGAQAIGALAYGTESIPRVDKIVGPGNLFVALAKKQVYGEVDIDSIAGPSEVVVVADEQANPHYVAADLLAQAEHDPLATAILITSSAALADQVNRSLSQQLLQLERREIAQEALKNNGVICMTQDIAEAISVANRLAPEHLELMIEDPWSWLPKVKHAGAVFLGSYSAESVGDYFAGPNHVLPTNGTVRFSSPLGVDSFIKRMSVIAYSEEAFQRDAQHIITLAEAEGLTAHAQSIRVRVDQEKGATTDGNETQRTD